MTTSQGQRKSYSTSVRFAALLLAFAGSTAAAPAYSASPRVSISGDSRSLNAILLDAIAALASLEPESGTPPEWLSTVGKLRRITDDAAVAVLAAYRVRGLTASEAMLASLALEMAVRRLASGAEAGTRLNGMLTRSDRAALTAAAEAGRAVSRTRWLAAVERDRAAAAAAALVHGLITAQDLVAGRAPAGARARSRSAALDSLAIAADTFKQIGEPRAAARAVLLSAAFTVSTWGEADLRELQEADTRIDVGSSLGFDEGQRASAASLRAAIGAFNLVHRTDDQAVHALVLDRLIAQLLELGTSREGGRSPEWLAVLVGATRQRMTKGCIEPSESRPLVDAAQAIANAACEFAPAQIGSTLLNEGSPEAAMEVVRAMGDQVRACAIDRGLPPTWATVLDTVHGRAVARLTRAAGEVVALGPTDATQLTPLDWRLAAVGEDLRMSRRPVSPREAAALSAGLRVILWVTSQRCGFGAMPRSAATARSSQAACGTARLSELKRAMVRTAALIAPFSMPELADHLGVGRPTVGPVDRGSIGAGVDFVVDAGDRALAAVAPGGLVLETVGATGSGDLGLLQSANHALRDIGTSGRPAPGLAVIGVRLPTGFFVIKPAGKAGAGSPGQVFKVPEYDDVLVFRVSAAMGSLVIERLRTTGQARPYDPASLRPWLLERPTVNEIAEVDRLP